MRRLLVLAVVVTPWLLVLVPADARAQGTGPCIHQGRQVQCPPGLPPGSQSINFVPGGTNWRNSMTGAIVFVPSTTFPPFVPTPTPTAPPSPTTQPGPGQPSGGHTGSFPFTADGFLVLTLPRDLPPGQTPEAATGVVPTTGRRRLVVAAEAHKAAEREENRAYGQLLLRLISEERYREVALATREAS